MESISSIVWYIFPLNLRKCLAWLNKSLSLFVQADDGVFITKAGKINFVDLAGSEMTKKTLSEGKTLEEANNINKSLMVLGESFIVNARGYKRKIFDLLI